MWVLREGWRSENSQTSRLRARVHTTVLVGWENTVISAHRTKLQDTEGEKRETGRFTRETRGERARAKQRSKKSLCVKVQLTQTLYNFRTSSAAYLLIISSSPQGGGEPRERVIQEERVGNDTLDARLLPAEEPSVRPPVPVQPQLRALEPSSSSQLSSVRNAVRLEAPWLRWNPCVCACVYQVPAVPTGGGLPESDRQCLYVLFSSNVFTYPDIKSAVNVYLWRTHI